MISPSRHRKSSHRSDWRHVRSTNTDLIYYTFISELHQHLQHMDSDLFRIIIQTWHRQGGGRPVSESGHAACRSGTAGISHILYLISASWRPSILFSNRNMPSGNCSSICSDASGSFGSGWWLLWNSTI